MATRTVGLCVNMCSMSVDTLYNFTGISYFVSNSSFQVLQSLIHHKSLWTLIASVMTTAHIDVVLLRENLCYSNKMK